jgi:hypothetical protein
MVQVGLLGGVYEWGFECIRETMAIILKKCQRGEKD